MKFVGGVYLIFFEKKKNESKNKYPGFFYV